MTALMREAARDKPWARLWNAPYLLLTLAVLFWSGNFIVARYVVGRVPPIALAYWRWTLALVLVVLFGWHHILRDARVLTQHWLLMLVLGLFGVAAFNTLVYLGLQQTTALNALILQSSMPLMIIGFSALLFGEPPSRWQLVGLLASVTGVLMIISRADIAALAGMTLNRGDVWIILAVACYSFYSSMLRKRPILHPLSFLAATFAVGSISLLPLYLTESTHMVLDRTGFAAIAYVAIFPGFLSLLLYNRGVDLIGANLSGHFLHLMPVFGSGLAIAVLGESFQWYHAVGALLIGAGILTATMGIVVAAWCGRR